MYAVLETWAKLKWQQIGMLTVNPSSLWQTAPFVAVFFGAMVVHEIALEAITNVYSLPPYNLPHIASSITLFQFGFCVLLPVAKVKVKRQSEITLFDCSRSFQHDSKHFIT